MGNLLPPAGARVPHHPRHATLAAMGRPHAIALEKDLGQTQIVGQGMLGEPAWYWPDQA